MYSSDSFGEVRISMGVRQESSQGQSVCHLCIHCPSDSNPFKYLVCAEDTLEAAGIPRCLGWVHILQFAANGLVKPLRL